MTFLSFARLRFAIVAFALVFGGTMAAISANPALAEAGKYASTLGDDGLHKQPWFKNSFLDMAEDLQEASDNGKRFAVLIEQKGCPYCGKLHANVIPDPTINEYFKENFDVVQIDMWGSREVTDFNGEAMEERDWVQKYGVVYTPTILFFEESMDAVKAKMDAGERPTSFRLQGYFEKPHFWLHLKFVNDKIYDESDFQRFVMTTFRDGGLPDFGSH